MSPFRNSPPPVIYSSTRHPFEVFLLALSVLSGLPVLIAGTAPDSITDALNDWAARAWGGGLAIGGAIALLGIYLTRPRPHATKISVTGLVVEQVGLVVVGGACLVYAAAVLLYFGLQGVGPAGIVLAYGVSCGWRWLQIQRLMILEHALRREGGQS